MIGNIVFGDSAASKRTETKRKKSEQVFDLKGGQKHGQPAASQHSDEQQDEIEIGLENFVVDDMLSAQELDDFVSISKKLSPSLTIDDLKIRLALDKYRARQHGYHEPNFNLAWINRLLSGNKQYGSTTTTMNSNILHEARRYFVERVLVLEE